MYVLIILTAVLFIGTLPIKDSESVKPGTVVVKNSMGTEVFDLNENGIRNIGTHILEIKNGKARVTHASCPLKICEKQGWLGEGVIVCVPNRVIIIITPNSSFHKKWM